MATHDDVAHNWAHGTGRKQNGHNMFYKGDAIYSYGSHFCIARFVRTCSGERVVLFNASTYSVSTSKHQTIVARAIPEGIRTISVEEPDIYSHDRRSHRLNYNGC